MRGIDLRNARDDFAAAGEFAEADQDEREHRAEQ